MPDKCSIDYTVSVDFTAASGMQFAVACVIVPGEVKPACTVMAAHHINNVCHALIHTSWQNICTYIKGESYGDCWHRKKLPGAKICSL
jgi:hypothetical protein